MSDIVKYASADGVAVITLHRPDSMNSFNTELRAAVVDAFARAEKDPEVRAIVFTGEGRCFSAGADLKAGIDRDVEDILQKEYRPVQEAIASIPKPVIAAVPGSAGLERRLQIDLLLPAGRGRNGAGRRCAAGCALQRHRNHPPPSRHSSCEDQGGPEIPCGCAGRAAQQGRAPGETWRAIGLLHMLFAA